MKVVVIPAEVHPCQESFLEEVLTRGDWGRRCTFLMRVDGEDVPTRTRWNDAAVETLPHRTRHRWVAQLRSYVTDLRYVPRILGLVRRERPDVVIARDMTFPLFVALCLRPVFGFAVVFQKTYPNELRWFDPHWVHMHRYPWLWVVCRRLEDWALHLMMRSTDANVPITPYMARELEKKWGHDPERNHPFGMGIHPDQSEPPAHSAAELGDEAPRLVYVGTLAPSRRLEVMVEAFARVVARTRGPIPHMTVIGGTEEEVAGLREAARAHGVDASVEFTGRLPRAEVYDVLRDNHVGLAYIPADPRFVVASPTKCIECLALGLPVVATDAVAVNCDLSDLTGAVVVTRDDAASYAMGIERAIDAYAELRAAAMATRHLVVEEYDYERMRERFWDLVEALASESHRVAVLGAPERSSKECS